MEIQDLGDLLDETVTPDHQGYQDHKDWEEKVDLTEDLELQEMQVWIIYILRLFALFKMRTKNCITFIMAY